MKEEQAERTLRAGAEAETASILWNGVQAKAARPRGDRTLRAGLVRSLTPSSAENIALFDVVVSRVRSRDSGGTLLIAEQEPLGGDSKKAS